GVAFLLAPPRGVLEARVRPGLALDRLELGAYPIPQAFEPFAGAGGVGLPVCHVVLRHCERPKVARQSRAPERRPGLLRRCAPRNDENQGPGPLAKPAPARQGKRMVPLSFAFDFCGEEFVLTKARALYWPRESALLVADLHLEKASFFARHGQLLPPYDSRETLERVALAIRETGARRVYTLGDNFHDSAGTERLEPHAAGMLAALTRA